MLARIIQTIAVVAVAGGSGSAQWTAAKEAQLFASDATANDYMGESVSVSGDTVLAGAVYDDLVAGAEAGSAYVFVRSGTSWSEQQKLVASDGAANDYFGQSVSLSGDTAVVGAIGAGPGSFQGAAYVFVRNGTSWTEQQKLVASDAAFGDRFGSSVAISGDTVVVGAREDDLDSGTDAGSVYVFVRSGTIWTERQKLVASDGSEGDEFGSSVAISGGTVVVGAIHADQDAADAGAAYVFVHDGTSWTEQQMLTASAAEEGDQFGCSVACSGDTALIGAWQDDHSTGGSQGSAYVFTRAGASWHQQAQLTASDAGNADGFGYSVALQGDMALTGSPFDKESFIPDAGSAYVFVRAGTTWAEQAKLMMNQPEDDEFGFSVALSGDTAVAGVHEDTVQGKFFAGSASVFRISASPTAYCTAGTSASGCQALLSAAGTASASAPSGFSLQASNVEGSKDGLFFFGSNGQQANSWGNGTSYQCVVPPLVRASTLSGSGTLGACDGSFVQDLNALWCPSCPKPAKNPGAGAIVQAQLWYRDPASTSNQTTSLSDAIEFMIGL